MNHRSRFHTAVYAGGLFLLLASLALAQPNDLIGVFFDAQGTVSTFETSAPNEIVPIYLILLEPSHVEAITSWECIFEARSNGPVGAFNWQLAGGGVNLDQPPRFFVTFETPLPPADVLVLATASVYVAEPGTEVSFYLHAFDPPSLLDPPGYGYPVETPNYGYGGGTLQSLGWTSGCESQPVALINDDGEVVAGELAGIPDQIHFGSTPPGNPVVQYFTLSNPGPIAVSGLLDVSGEGFHFAHS